MPRVLLSYGHHQLPFQLESSRLAGILKPNILPEPIDGGRLIYEALHASATIQKLARLREGAPRLSLIVPDKTRNCGAAIVLPILVRKLNDLGIPDAQMRIVLALGSHSAHEGGEIEQIVGSEIFGRMEVVEHDSRSETLVFLGETKFGTPVHINRDLVEADRIIIVGTAVHHYFAGYGGGPKMINPGCAGYETITRNHARTIDSKSGGIHPNCRAGVVTGNPVQEDILDSLRFISADFLLETVLDAEGRIIEVFSGELLEAHEQACKCVDELYKIAISELADMVVVSCGGYPKDINLIQAHKSLNNAFYAVKPGGVILALAECRDGIGSQTFMDWFKYSDEEDLLAELQRNYTLNGTTALSLRMKTKACKIVFVSGLPEQTVSTLGMYPAASLEQGLRLAEDLLPRSFSCYVMPNGSLTLPFLNETKS